MTSLPLDIIDEVLHNIDVRREHITGRGPRDTFPPATYKPGQPLPVAP